MPVAIPIAMVAAGAIAGGASVYGARQQGRSSQRAGEIQERSNTAALDYERQQAEEDKRRFEEEQAAKQKQFDADEAFRQNQWKASEEDRLFHRMLLEQQEARRAPYRAASRAALQRIGDMLGIHFDSSVQAPTIAAAGAGTPTGAVAMPSSASRVYNPSTPQPSSPTIAGPATQVSYAPVLQDPRAFPRRGVRDGGWIPTSARGGGLRRIPSIGDLVQQRRLA